MEELRELHSAATAAAAPDGVARGRSGGCASITFGVAPADVPDEGGDAAASAARQQAAELQQQRDAVVTALWRLLRAKDSEAVSYLLGVDPGCAANQTIAGLLKEMRSWVYLNMW